MSDWQPIETVPKMKIVLLWAVTDLGPDGEVRNWKMATGCRCTGSEAREWWEWSGYILRDYDIPPTHWMPLPDPPLTSAYQG